MSCAVITLVEVPTMPVLPIRLDDDVDRRQDQRIVLRNCALREYKIASTSTAPGRPSFKSHDTTFLRLRSRNRRTHRVKTKPDAKDAARHPCTGAGLTCGMSWEISLSRPSHRHCRHRCERPLRMDAPSTGWVTALAGLLARGSLPQWSGLPSFPVAVLDARLAAHSCGGSHGLLRIRMFELEISVFPLSSPK